MDPHIRSFYITGDWIVMLTNPTNYNNKISLFLKKRLINKNNF